MRRSDNKGLTWSLVGTPGGFPISVHTPYNGNESGNIVYRTDQRSGADKVLVSTNSGVTFSEVLDLSSVSVARWSVETYTQNNQIIYAVDSGTSPDTLYVSEDGFSTSSAASMNGVAGTFNILSTGGFPYNGSQFYLVTDTGIYSSLDRGENWTERTGDWSLGLSGTSVIVPLWTE